MSLTIEKVQESLNPPPKRKYSSKYKPVPPEQNKRNKPKRQYINPLQGTDKTHKELSPEEKREYANWYFNEVIKKKRKDLKKE